MIFRMYYVFLVSDSWLISRIAKKVYVVSALLTLYVVCLLSTILLATIFAEGTLVQSPLLASVLKVLLLPGVFGTALLWIGMIYFWYQHHPNDGMSKPLWAAALWIFGPVGALLYFKLVYLRSPILNDPLKQAAATA
jgi:hypothetical protein